MIFAEIYILNIIGDFDLSIVEEVLLFNLVVNINWLYYIRMNTAVLLWRFIVDLHFHGFDLG